MSEKIRKYHSDEFKFRVACEAIKGQKTVVELCQEFGVVQSQIYLWRLELEKNGASIFSDKRKSGNKDEIEKLHRIIGKITVERDFLERAFNRLK
jgi:transposase